MSDWPKRPDGTNMTIGEMSAEQRRTQFKSAITKLIEEFNEPAVKSALAKALVDFDQASK